MTYLEKINNLLSAYQDDSDMVDTIEESIDAMIDYHTTVAHTETAITLARHRATDQKDLVQQIKQADIRRKTAHDSAIVAVNILNRLTKLADQPTFAPIDTENRQEVGDFIGFFMQETFANRYKVKARDLAKETGPTKDRTLLLPEFDR